MRERYLDVGAEVVDLSTAGRVKVVVGPAQQQLLWGELHQVLQALTIPQQGHQGYTHTHTVSFSLAASFYHDLSY